MKNNQKRITKKFLSLCSNKLAVALAMVGLLAAAPMVQAGVTQLSFLQTLVQVTGDSGQFSGSSTAGDYIQWASAKGLTPSGGWNLSGNLSKGQLAQLLVQLLNLNPKKGGGDYVRVLQREGIDLSGIADDAAISGANVASILGNGSFPVAFVNTGSPAKGNNGVGNGEDPPPPGFLNPKNPHFGGGQNDGPGTGPGNPNPHNKP